MFTIGRGLWVTIGAIIIALAAFFTGRFSENENVTFSIPPISSHDKKRWLNYSDRLNELTMNRLSQCPQYQLSCAACEMLLISEARQGGPYILNATLHSAQPNTEGVDFLLDFSAFSLARGMNELIFFVIADGERFVIRYDICSQLEASEKDDNPYYVVPFYIKAVTLEELKLRATTFFGGVPCVHAERFPTSDAKENSIPLPIGIPDIIIGVAVIDRTTGVSNFTHIKLVDDGGDMERDR